MKLCSKISLVFVILVISFTVLFAFLRHSSPLFSTDYKDIIASGTLRVVIEKNTMSYVVVNDTNVMGLQYKMVEQLAKDWGVTVQYIDASDLGSAINMLNNNEVDIVVWHIPIHVEMEDKIAFTVPVFTSRQVLVQRKNTPHTLIRNQLDLARKTIHIPKDSPYKQRIQNLAKEIGDSIFIVEINEISIDSLFYKVANAEIDFTVCEKVVASIEKKKYPTLDTETAIGFKQNYAWAIRQNSSELQDSVNNWLNYFLETKEYNRIYQKYTNSRKQ
ncbi:MAG TPA: transporter substrate-binding domain-containing protein [Paludibacteraceae bacterium]|nr:transporter substrate-binding domain-containing protein [Paludibacteraceae bacterium]